MKKCLLWLAAALFLATVSVPPVMHADEPPVCGPNGCQKPGVR